MPSRPPDLVLLMTDQQRFDQVGWATGGPLRTPNLDALASRGVVFEHAYSGSTTCVPARTSLLTGVLDHRIAPTDRHAIAPGGFTVARALAAVGYQTALVGKMHFDPIRTDHGFEHARLCEHLGAYPVAPSELQELDHYHDWLVSQGLPDIRLDPDRKLDGVFPLDPLAHPTAWVEREAASVLAGRDPERPLFLVVSFPHPHPPIDPPEPYASMYDPADCEIDPAWADDNRRLPAHFRRELAQAEAPGRRVHADQLDAHRRSLARSYGLISQVDDSIGRLVDLIDLDRSLLFFTSDHGDYAGRRGLLRKIPWIPFDDLARVPLFAVGGPVAGGRRTTSPVQSFDLTATFLEAGGVPDALGLDPAELDGVSQLGHLADPSIVPDGDRPVFSAISMKWLMVRRGPHKYIRSAGWGEEVLFDVIEDPGETLDLKAMDPDRRLLDDLASLVDERAAAPPAVLPATTGHLPT